METLNTKCVPVLTVLTEPKGLLGTWDERGTAKTENRKREKK